MSAIVWAIGILIALFIVISILPLAVKSCLILLAVAIPIALVVGGIAVGGFVGGIIVIFGVIVGVVVFACLSSGIGAADY